MKVMMIMHIVMPMTITEHDESDDDYAHCNADDTIMEQWRLFLSDGFGFHGKPTTEFMGWRRLTPAELLHLDVIPPNLRHEDSDMIKLRKVFTIRVNKAVIWSKQNESPENGQSLEWRAIHYLHQHNYYYFPADHNQPTNSATTLLMLLTKAIISFHRLFSCSSVCYVANIIFPYWPVVNIKNVYAEDLL
jgi:hypothetical protein